MLESDLFWGGWRTHLVTTENTDMDVMSGHWSTPSTSSFHFDLPSPFKYDHSCVHFGVRFVHLKCGRARWLRCFPQIFDGTRLIKGTSDRGNVPVKEVIKLLSYEAGKIPFLNLVGQSITETYTLHGSPYNNSSLSDYFGFQNSKKRCEEKNQGLS